MRHLPIQQFRRAATVALLAPIVGCAAEAGADRRAGAASLATGEPVMPTVSDYDGVRTMTHDAAAFDRAPRLEAVPKPFAVLGAPDDDPAYDLTHVSEVALLSDGRTATRSAIGARVLLFDERGRGERVIGRMGQGPGEFVRAESLVRLGGDTLLILDTANGRLNAVHPETGMAAASPVAPERTLVHARPLPQPLPDGRLVLQVGGPPSAGEVGSTSRGPASIALLARDGARPRTIATLPGWEYTTIETRYRGRARPNVTPLEFGRRPHAAVLESLIVVGDGDTYELRALSPDGVVAWTITAQRARRAVTAPMRDAVIARTLAGYDDARTERMVDPDESRRLAREQPFADSLPPYSAIMTSRDGTLWVVDSIAPTDTAWSATALRADGAIVGRLHASGRGRPMAFEGDRVAVRDERDDQPSARRYTTTYGTSSESRATPTTWPRTICGAG